MIGLGYLLVMVIIQRERPSKVLWTTMEARQSKKKNNITKLLNGDKLASTQSMEYKINTHTTIKGFRAVHSICLSF